MQASAAPASPAKARGPGLSALELYFLLGLDLLRPSANPKQGLSRARWAAHAHGCSWTETRKCRETRSVFRYFVLLSWPLLCCWCGGAVVFNNKVIGRGLSQTSDSRKAALGRALCRRGVLAREAAMHRHAGPLVPRQVNSFSRMVGEPVVPDQPSLPTFKGSMCYLKRAFAIIRDPTLHPSLA